MANNKKLDIKNRPYYFYNSMTKMYDQVSFKKSTDCVSYCIEYFKNLYSSNSLYLVFNNVDAYIEGNSTEEKKENKYLTFASTDKNREALENYKELWDEIKDQIELISGNKPIKSEKDFMKIIARPDFQEDKYYPDVYLHECLYEYEYEYENDSYSIV